MEDARACDPDDEKDAKRFDETDRSVATENSGLTRVDVAAGVADLRSCRNSLVGLRSGTWLGLEDEEGKV